MLPNETNTTSQADNRIDQIHGVLERIVSVLHPLRFEESQYSGLTIWADGIFLALIKDTPDFVNQLKTRLNNKQLYGLSQDIKLIKIPAPSEATSIVKDQLYIMPEKKNYPKFGYKARISVLPGQGKLINRDEIFLDSSKMTIWRIGRGERFMDTTLKLLRTNEIAIDGDDKGVEEEYRRQVSSRHAHIEFSEGTFYISSDNSRVRSRILRSGYASPIEVNAKRELKDKDQIILGDLITLLFEIL